ncbi:MAG: SDR family oxidoreductase [Planctomycetales bacterium]|nr:SDR family oxidoreductase [Planctomycetales bacterium]
MTQLSGKTAVITGASQGIGLAIAHAFAAAGARLAVAARSADKVQQAAAELAPHGGAVLAVSTDVTDERQVATLFDQVDQQFGRIDLLVNNAGAFDGGPLDQLPLAAWRKVIDTNLTGPFLCTQAALKRMKRQQSGRIINIGSISAQRVRPESAAYSASKHGLWGLTQVAALEGRAYGVTCCCLHPGNTMVERRHTDKPEDAEPMIAAESIAQVALLMATLPEDAEMLEAIVLPRGQQYVGRG